jgi:hypothetical protein
MQVIMDLRDKSQYMLTPESTLDDFIDSLVQVDVEQVLRIVDGDDVSDVETGDGAVENGKGDDKPDEKAPLDSEKPAGVSEPTAENGVVTLYTGPPKVDTPFSDVLANFPQHIKLVFDELMVTVSGMFPLDDFFAMLECCIVCCGWSIRCVNKRKKRSAESVN